MSFRNDMAKIGKIELMNLKETDKELEADLMLNHVYVGMIVMKQMNDHCRGMEITVGKEYLSAVEKEAEKCVRAVGFRNFSKGRALSLLAKYMLGMAIQERRYQEIQLSYGLDYYLEVIYKNDGLAILPGSDKNVLDFIAVMLDADDSVDSVKVVGEDTFTIDVEEKHTDERYFN